MAKVSKVRKMDALPERFDEPNHIVISTGS
jgi:hypothetical protein